MQTPPTIRCKQMMTVRQMLTVILSSVAFSHNLAPLQWFSAAAVFASLFAKARLSRSKRMGSVGTAGTPAVALSSAPAASGASFRHRWGWRGGGNS